MKYSNSHGITSITLHQTFHEPAERTRRPAPSLGFLRLWHLFRSRSWLLGEMRKRVELLSSVQTLARVGQEPHLLGEAVALLVHGARVDAAQGRGGVLPVPRLPGQGGHGLGAALASAVTKSVENGRGPALGARSGRRLGVVVTITRMQGRPAVTVGRSLEVIHLLDPDRGLEDKA